VLEIGVEGREGREGVGRDGRGKKGWEGRGMGRKRRGGSQEGKEGYGRGKRVGKGEGELDLDICSGAPESLVTPLRLARTQRTVHWMEVQVPDEKGTRRLVLSHCSLKCIRMCGAE